MPNSIKKTQPLLNDKGREICGAKLKNLKKKDGTVKKNRVCQKSPLVTLGRCHVHGGKSTGPKNSVAYYKKTVLEKEGATTLGDALGLENPLDLTGEIGLVRNLLTQMMDDPLKVYCSSCKMWVTADVYCPNEEDDNEKRRSDGKPEIDHHVKVRDNDFGKMILATKQLSEVAKNHKEIQKGKEITVRVEVLNLVIMKVVQAYEEADKLSDPTARRRKFVEGVDRLLIEGTELGAAQGARAGQAAI